MPKLNLLGRILALDYGKVRTGVAVTDELKLIASGYGTIATKTLFSFLQEYFDKEQVECVVVGLPKQMNGQASESEELILPFLKKFGTTFPNMKVERQDERFTSKMAVRSMVQAGVKKKKRQDKALVDEISATLILQGYLNSR